MLVFTRRRHDSVMIGPDIEMQILEIRGDKVRIGFAAPPTVPIHRKEIYDQIVRENLQAAKIQLSDVADPFLRAAIDEARQGQHEGGLPIGSVLVREDKIIARGHDRRVQMDDPLALAEIDCLRSATRLKTYRDTILYSTLMPSYACGGAMIQLGIPKVINGGQPSRGKSPDFLRAGGVEVIDLHDHECVEMMSAFLREHPQFGDNQIGMD